MWRDSYMYHELELVQFGSMEIVFREKLDCVVVPTTNSRRIRLERSFDARCLIKFVKPFGFLKDNIVAEDDLKIIKLPDPCNLMM